MKIIKKHHKKILQLGYPIAIGQVGILVQSFADTIMLGQYSTNDLSAAAFVNALFNTTLFLIMGFAFGITPIISGYFGRNEPKEVASTFKNGLVLNLLGQFVVLGFMGSLYFFIPFLHQPKELLPIINPVYIAMWLSMYFVSIFHVIRQLTDGTLDTKIGMWILIGGNVLNIIGNFFFIYGIYPFPEMGAFGAALSTLIARILMALAIIVVIWQKKRYHIYIKDFIHIPIDWKFLLRLFKQSYPVALQMGMESGVFTICQIMAGWIDTTAMAAYNVLLTMSLLGYLIYVSFANSTSLRIGTFVGQDDWENVRQATRAGLEINLVLSFIVAFIFLAYGADLLTLFSSDSKVIAVGAGLMLPMFIYQICDSMQVTHAQCLRGLSHVKAMMGYGFIGYFLFGIPVCYILGVLYLKDASGFFYGLSFALAVSVILYHFRLKKALVNKEVGFDFNQTS